MYGLLTKREVKMAGYLAKLNNIKLSSKVNYCTTSSASGQDEPNLAL